MSVNVDLRISKFVHCVKEISELRQAEGILRFAGAHY